MDTSIKSKLPPGPKPKIPLTNLFDFRKDSLAFLKRIADEYGDIVHFKLGLYRVVLLNHPDFIKQVLSTHNDNFVKGRPLEMAKELMGEGLLTSEGEFHKQQSRIIQPAFSTKMMDHYGPVMTFYANNLMKKWNDGTTIDVLSEMVEMSIEIAGKTMFSIDIKKEVPEITQALEKITVLFKRISLPFSEYLLNLPLPSTYRFYKARTQIDDIIYRIIKARKKSRLDNGDLLSLLLNAEVHSGTKGVLTDKQIRDEALTLFLTAFDTTSLALSWTWYLLSQNPEAEQKLHNELENVLEGRLPTINDIPKLVYTKNIFAESMRIYPPIYIIARQSLEEFSISNYMIPKGTLVLMSPYLIHHDKRFHNDPERFNPDVWSKKNAYHQSRFDYFPFSRGARACIGQHYAWLEGVLVLATIAQYWKLERIPGNTVEIEQLINLRPRNGLKMKLSRRKN
ncbi:cytochrome P450 [Gramella jeungdoensis]|uniref:Cytochrome P450 n=1 Tax=Gramella jeungdoensis TaxID=708091 RepID=A0ABT0Z2M4_9FLAO|nr:cytochrome P450 [Gramella jeungdoensis]MCM8569382.1 cytochrome P450 [Gramella jeungdoensis]